ncbi:Aliphatic amidase expression-regulating protein [Aquisphaera giovannonii]|uniref:Aliphatic amidase expression-regulating protein n=1 Tax=Aquisphaera giovannonii TaxID=406548 RepID=A0A5B9VVL2_9BACT|nr:urea ABC transporter substrate-binding protein [Aquisphaera giovannonii]QEH31891.1 Aliphatic amidase expression-regulating protein [Aquisphaera giovannonii]
MRRSLIGLVGLGVLAAAGWWGVPYLLWRAEAPIKVGLLHSRTGPLEISERSMIEAELLAIEDINAEGGIAGRRVLAVVADGRSDPSVFAQEARRLIEADRVSVIVGCWSGLSRRKVRDVVQASGHLLIFPSNYEGMDTAPGVVCTGPIPNQQVIPAVNWCSEKLRARKFFLAGSQDVQSYSSNALIKDQLKAIGAEGVGEKYVGLDGSGMAEMVAAIKAAAPDVVLSTVVGDGNKPFYQQLAAAGLTPSKVPVLSFTIGEEELRSLPAKDMVGDYAAWSYFQSLDTEENRRFVERFRAKYGEDRVTSDGIVAAYNAIRLWALAVDEAGTDATAEVRKSIQRESRFGPEGIVSIDPATLHTFRPFRMGKVRADGQFDVVWSLEKPVRPVPFPMLRTRAQWTEFVDRLYTTWGTKEFNPQALGDPASGPPSAPPAVARRPGPGPRPLAPAAAARAAADAASTAGTRRNGTYQR